ncbi:MAG: hypothetical protein HUU21_28300 [Polyangiaceae bacterium]|nr:hypothetical protein [Polyangiaceae bacterium]
MSSVRRFGPASIVLPRGIGNVLAVLAASISLLSCNTPTQVTVTVTTDVACKRLKGTKITVGTVDTLEKNPSTSETTNCTEGQDGLNRIGTVVLIPDASNDDKFAIKVVAGVDRVPDTCGDGGDFAGCIIARRSLNFISHTELELPIFLSSSCEGVPCTARPDETCVLGACVPAAIADPSLCQEVTDCGDDILTDPTKPPKPESVECGRPSVIADDFQAEMPGSQWIVEKPMTGAVSQAGGVLTLTPPTDAAMPAEVRYRSKHAVNLSRDAITVQVPTALTNGSGIRAYLAAEIGASRLMIEHKDGTLRFVSTDSDGVPAETSKPYDPKKHVWWEIRATSTKIVLRTSPNGIDWEAGATFTRPSFADNVYIVLGAGVDGKLNASDAVSFDNLNQGRPPAFWCPVNTLTDDFATAQVSPQWNVEVTPPGSCEITQVDGNLVLSIGGGSTSLCTYRSRSAFNLLDNSIVLDLQELADIVPNMSFSVMARDDASRDIQIGVEPDGGGMPSFFALRRLGDGVNTPVYVPFTGVPKLLRIRESKGKVVFETSSNGTMWDAPILDQEIVMTLEAVDVTIRLETFTPIAQDVTAKVGQINRP